MFNLERYYEEILNYKDGYACFRCARPIGAKSYIPDKNLYTPWRDYVYCVACFVSFEDIYKMMVEIYSEGSKGNGSI